MFKELKAHLITIAAQKRGSMQGSAVDSAEETSPLVTPISIKNIPPSLTVKSLQA